MVYEFKLKGEVPAKKNNRQTLRSGKTIPSKNYQNWHEMALFNLILQKKAQKIEKPLNQKLTVVVKFIHGDFIRRDGDNGLSSVLDTIKDAGIIDDDNWKICTTLVVVNEYKEKAPECHVKIMAQNTN